MMTKQVFTCLCALIIAVAILGCGNYHESPHPVDMKAKDISVAFTSPEFKGEKLRLINLNCRKDNGACGMHTLSARLEKIINSGKYNIVQITKRDRDWSSEVDIYYIEAVTR